VFHRFFFFFPEGIVIVFIYGCASAAVAPTLERDMENSIIINPLRDEAEAGIM
jgi:hypothetical protein